MGVPPVFIHFIYFYFGVFREINHPAMVAPENYGKPHMAQATCLLQFTNG